MTTKTVKSESPHIAALRRIIAGPQEVGIVGATAYWLGDTVGNPLGPESDRTLAPCAEALTMVDAGTDPDTLVVWARLADGRPYRARASGIAAGIPGLSATIAAVHPAVLLVVKATIGDAVAEAARTSGFVGPVVRLPFPVRRWQKVYVRELAAALDRLEALEAPRLSPA